MSVPAPTRVGGLHHVALPVRDLTASVEWYAAVLDATVLRRTDQDAADLDAGRTAQAWLQVGEVVVNLASGPVVSRSEDQHFFHYALSVDGDLGSWMARLDAHGVAVLGPYGHGGLSFVSVYFDDPDGYRWEIVVDHDSHPEARAAALAHGGVLGNPMASYDWVETPLAQTLTTADSAVIATAEEAGYRFTVRHQPAVELEEPDWVVVVTAPDGRMLFPGAVESAEDRAWRRAAARVRRDLAQRGAVAD